MPKWSVDLPASPAAVARLLAEGWVLALDIDPRTPAVVLTPRQPGLGDAMVGQRVVYRQWLGAGGDEAVGDDELEAVFGAVRQGLDTVEAGTLLDTVSAGYRVSRLWSGDELGDWTPEAWSAARAVVACVVAAMEGVD